MPPPSAPARAALCVALCAAAAPAFAAPVPPPPVAAPAPPPPAPRRARLVGRVLERGSAVVLVGATVESSGGAEPVTADAEGRFTLEVPPGAVDVVVTQPGYEPLRVVEELPPGVARTAEYRLAPRPSGDRSRYRTTVQSTVPHEGERFTIRDEELHEAPGAAGDPMRVIASLPGVIAPIPVLPVYVVRGGGPGTSGFFLDGMRVPQLFHLVFVDGVVHPRLFDRIDFFPGAYDATFGRYASGVIDAATRPGRTDAPLHAEVELRLFDASALVEARLPYGASIAVAGRYGFPAPVVHLVEPGVDLSYWDYQLRFDLGGFGVEALGSYDALAVTLPRAMGAGRPAAQLYVEFHRLQVREQLRRGRLAIEAALVGGVDRMSVFTGEGVEKLALSGRVAARLRLWRLALAAGADGEVSRFTPSRFTGDQAGAAPDALGDLVGQRDGVVAGGYLQGTLDLDALVRRPLRVTLGVRADTYHAGTVTLLGVDPRLLFRYQPIDLVELFGGVGQYTQPPSFPIPLPGIDTFALALGLQRAWQASVGMRFRLPEDVSLSLTGYYGRFDHLNDVVLDFQSSACTTPPPESVRGIAAYVTRQVEGAGYGMELLLRRQTGRVTGWVAYTLSRSERSFACGLLPSDFDQTHVLSAVVHVRLPWRLTLGARLNLQTGRPYTQLALDLATATVSGTRNNQRLPTYVQLDVRIDREWIFRRWVLALFVEALNLTYAESVYGVTYPKDMQLMITRYDQPEPQGFRWILPSIGARGRF